MAERFQHPTRVMGSAVSGVVQKAKLFVCGAGGIGCELLKSLVLTGFADIEVIDMDTVDASNLNRQFLFRAHHVSKSKATVARETALKYNPHAKIIAHHGNVKDAQFDTDFFKRFDIVLNGLDNRSARSHVNRMCMKAEIPLIESGTMGYNGQVQPIIKNQTECYDCKPKQTGQISYAVCTIHQRPSSMVHCTHYAKEFYKRFFFNQSGQLDPEMEYMAKLRTDDPQESAKRIFDAVFSQKIDELTSLKGGNWGTGKAPRAVTYSMAVEGKADEAEKAGEAGDAEQQGKLASQTVSSVRQLAELFIASFVSLSARAEQHPWDKDDDEALRLTVAVANLRAWNFHIALESEFSIKSIAGNIIPAIATSNAVMSGAIVIECLKVLASKSPIAGHHLAKPTVQSLRRFPARIKRKACYIVPEVPPTLNEKCYVCQSGRNEMHLRLNASKTTVQFVVDVLCGHECSMSHPMVSLVKGEDEKLLYEDEEMIHNASKPLSAWIDLADGASGWSLLLEDMVQELKTELFLTHDAALDPADYVLTGEKPIAKAAKATGSGDASVEPTDEDGDDIVVYHPRKVGISSAVPAPPSKQQAEDVDGTEPAAKKRRVAS